MAVVVGLTGSIGMGKSTVAAMLRRLGVPVWDADAEVRRLQGPGGALLPAIEALFPGTTGPAGVDRERLGRAVFGDPAKLRRLEALVHPAVGRTRTAFLRRHRARPVVVLDIPLLFETRPRRPWRQRGFDLIATVSAAPFQQRARVLRRPGMTAGRLRQIRALQTPDRIKRARSDVVIPTGGPRDATGAAVRALVGGLRARGTACLRRAAGR